MKLCEWKEGARVKRRSGFISDTKVTGVVVGKPFKTTKKAHSYSVMVQIDKDCLFRGGRCEPFPMTILEII